jgi:NAD(P)-dependent dehydrogenase (short-subunit alcohol dehydrogenase family)
MVALVAGAAGGIGAALGAEILERYRLRRLFVVSRGDPPASFAGDRVVALRADLLAPGATVELARSVAGFEARLDLVFNCCGLLHDGDLKPEKSVAAIDAGALERLFAVNATLPALLARDLGSAAAALARCGIREPVGAGRQHRGQSRGRLVRLPREQGGAQHAAAHAGTGVAPCAAAHGVPDAAARNGRHATIAAVPECAHARARDDAGAGCPAPARRGRARGPGGLRQLPRLAGSGGAVVSGGADDCWDDIR